MVGQYEGTWLLDVTEALQDAVGSFLAVGALQGSRVKASGNNQLFRIELSDVDELGVSVLRVHQVKIPLMCGTASSFKHPSLLISCDEKCN